MKIIDNRNSSVVADMSEQINDESKLSIAAACFSMYAYRELKEQLSKVDELRFLFTTSSYFEEARGLSSKVDSAESTIAESLTGTEFEKQIMNIINQRAIAQECMQWINKENIHFRAISKKVIPNGFAVVHPRNKPKESIVYTPIDDFSAASLGLNESSTSIRLTQQLDAPYSLEYLRVFNEIWKGQKDVKQAILKQLSEMFQENSPEMIYYAALYNIFNDYLKDISIENFADERTGFKDSIIWKKLFDFQKDAALAIINKLDKYNGCILADSVGLGKTYTALSVIKYYESKNLRVLVLCPKKLSNNWNTFKGNTKNNELLGDRFAYDVCYHTDLSMIHRKNSKVMINGIPLNQINWGNYDLVVIDESHNFRNGASKSNSESKSNRYDILMNEIINKGVKTKVLMLSATPVNNRFSDLEKQIELAYEDGDSHSMEEKMGINSIRGVFAKAQNAYNKWSNGKPEERTTEKLLELLDFDFFELLDNVTIARSRKHVTDYYDISKIGAFPRRLAPISVSPGITKDDSLYDYDFFFDGLIKMNLGIYTPSLYIRREMLSKYEDQLYSKNNRSLSQQNRENGLRHLMAINLLKRMESSIDSFRLSLERLQTKISMMIKKIDTYSSGISTNQYTEADINDEEFSTFDTEDEDNFLSIGTKIKIQLSDIDLKVWREDLIADLEIIADLYSKASGITPSKDNKLEELKNIIIGKTNRPINIGNKKLLVFTAFADTANYLYDNLREFCKKNGLSVAVVTGTSEGRTSIEGFKCSFESILTCFSPISKQRSAIYENGIEANANIDILIGTDCISEGQNLQDCDLCVNYDIHWNPIRIIQRYGRIDRIGSRNSFIQLINFWPDASLDHYIDLKRRVESRMLAGFMVNPAEAKVISDENEVELAYRKVQLEKLKNETVDIEDISENISITDLGLNEFRLDLLNFTKNRDDLSRPHKGIYAVTYANDQDAKGVIFVLKSIRAKNKIKSANRLHPYYLVYISESGSVVVNYLQPKESLMLLKMYGKEKELVKSAIDTFNKETCDGKEMDKYIQLLKKSVESILSETKQEKVMSLFKSGSNSFSEKIEGINDFELICYLILK